LPRCAGCRSSRTSCAASSATRTCATSPNSPTTYVRLGNFSVYGSKRPAGTAGSTARLPPARPAPPGSKPPTPTSRHSRPTFTPVAWPLPLPRRPGSKKQPWCTTILDWISRVLRKVMRPRRAVSPGQSAAGRRSCPPGVVQVSESVGLAATSLEPRRCSRTLVRRSCSSRGMPRSLDWAGRDDASSAGVGRPAGPAGRPRASRPGHHTRSPSR
jgi:hypothetical protein